MLEFLIKSFRLPPKPVTRSGISKGCGSCSSSSSGSSSPKITTAGLTCSTSADAFVRGPCSPSHHSCTSMGRETRIWYELGERCQMTASDLCHGNNTQKIQRCRTCFKMAQLTVHTGKQLHDQPKEGANATLSHSTKLPVHHCQVRWKNWPPNVAVNFLCDQHDVDGHKPTTTVMTMVPHATKLPQPSNPAQQLVEQIAELPAEKRRKCLRQSRQCWHLVLPKMQMRTCLSLKPALDSLRPNLR